MASLAHRVARMLFAALGIESRFVATWIARHHVYDTRGQGTPIVCLPGLSDSAASWLPLVLALRRKGHRVLVVEGAGHGLSDQASCAYTVETHFESVTSVLDELLDRPALLVGNSLGGATALHVATVRPGLACALFLASPAGALDEQSLAGVRAAFTMSSLGDARAFLSRVLHRMTPLHRPLARVVFAASASRAVRDIVASLRTDLEIAGIGALSLPICVAWGGSERLLPTTSLDWLRAQLPPHALVTQPAGFGHCPHLDDPWRLARMIDAFAIASAAASRAAAPLAAAS